MNQLRRAVDAQSVNNNDGLTPYLQALYQRMRYHNNGRATHGSDSISIASSSSDSFDDDKENSFYEKSYQCKRFSTKIFKKRSLKKKFL